MEEFIEMVKVMRKVYTLDWFARAFKASLTQEEIAVLIERLSV